MATEWTDFMPNIRPCRDSDRAAILAIINSAAEAYRGVIPADRWHEPYMSTHELRTGRALAANTTPRPGTSKFSIPKL